MTINFIELGLKNILSYGPETQKFVFKKGIDLIANKNGQGKSAIIDGLFFALYGKAFRKIKQSSLINNVSKKKLEVYLIFEIQGITYKVVRGLSPGKFEIYKKEKEEFSLMEQQASTKDYQKILDSIIKVNDSVFRQLIVLGSNIPGSKPFMELNQKEKEEVFQIVTDLSFFSLMKDVIKEETSLLKSSKKDFDFRYNVVLESIEQEEKSLKEKIQKNQEYKETKEKNIQEYKNKILDLENTNLELYKELESLKELKQEYIQLKDEVQSLKNKTSNKEQEVQQLKLKLLEIKQAKESSIVCKDCGSINYQIPIDEDFIANISTYKEKYINLQQELNLLKETFSKKEHELNLLKETLLKGSVIKDKIDSNCSNISYHQASIKQLECMEEVSIDTSYKEKLKEDLKSIKQELDKVNKSLEDYSEINNIIGTNNLKGALIKRTIPLLNKYINNFLESFSLNEFNFIVDENFNETLINRDNAGEFNQLSNGQKSRISFSILFAFLKLIEESNGVSINILILDEVLDSSVDLEGREDLLTLLKTEFSRDKDIIIISHNDEIKGKVEIFDRFVNISRDKFSKIHIELKES